MQSDCFDQPLYVSKRLFRNFWQQYRIYTDRIELRSSVGRKVIRAEDILRVEVRPPIVIGDFFRRKGLAQSFALKLDLEDFAVTSQSIAGPAGSSTSASPRTIRIRL